MKRISRLLLLLLIFSVSLNAENPHLTLYFDINKTLIASDKATGKSVDDVLNELLAEKFVGYWDDSQQEMMTFNKYIEKVLLPKNLNADESRNLKEYYLIHFTDFLKANNHPSYDLVIKEYETAHSKLAKAKGSIFPSFYFLLDHLDQKKISYSVVLRSMGHEIEDVKAEITSIHGLNFSHTGKFRNGHLLIDDEQPIEGHIKIYHHLRRIPHAAIHDHYDYWKSGKFESPFGKPFYVDKNDPETLSIFFDDNICVKDVGISILAPLDPYTGKLISVEELVDLGQAVRVNALDAILQDDYFINHVESALKKHEAKFQPAIAL